MENQLKVHHKSSYVKHIKGAALIIAFMMFFGFAGYKQFITVKKADAVVGQLTIPGEATTLNVQSVQSTSLQLTTVNCGQGDNDGYSILKTVSNVGAIDCDNNVRVDAQGKMTVAGNIGIGTTDPGLYKLNVQGGNANFSNTGTFGGLLTISAGGITSAGTITFSSLTASRPVKTSTGGVLSASQISLNSTNDVAGTLPVANGGTGATTLTGILKGNGTSALTDITGTANYIPKWSDANTISGTSSIYDNGNVGIGTTVTNKLLHLYGSDASIRIQNSVANAGTMGILFNHHTTADRAKTGILSVASGESYGRASLILAVNNAASATDVSASDTTMVLHQTGNVGIGKNPEVKLDVGTTTSDIIRSYGGFSGHATANIGGTGAAAYFPNGAWLNTGPQWIYGTVTFNGALSGATSFTTSGTVTASGGNSGNWNTAYSHVSSNGSSHTFINQNVTTTGAPTFATVNTGQGANELYDMNQNVLTTSSPTFAGLTSNGNVGIGTTTIPTNGRLFVTKAGTYPAITAYNHNGSTSNSPAASYYGVYASTSSDTATNKMGVAGLGTGTAGTKYGLYGYASGNGTNYAVYAYATGGTTNYSGYFHGAPVFSTSEFRSNYLNNFRIVGGNYGAFLRNDGTDYYILFTNSGDQYGSWSSLRPFRANLATGNVSMEHNVYVGGDVGIGVNPPSYKLHVAGTIYASGSSRRYKENISDLEIDTAKIYQLQPVSFDYKPEYKDFGKILGGGHQIGLIAEDTYKIIPELAVYSEGRISNVDYEKLSILLLAEMKKQKQSLDALEDKIKSLENRLNQLESKVNLSIDQ
ncbi:MAG: tail fiber domain-containing protein [Patescibacteria group bacterium]